jgi:Ankyrin repeats (many copies)
MKRQLPPRPSLEQLKKQAKMILKGHQAGDLQTLKRIQEQHPRWRKASESAIQRAHFTLSDAQLVLANEYGFETWSKLRIHVLLHRGGPSNEETVKLLRAAAGRGDLERLAELLDTHPDLINERAGEGTRTALHSAVFGDQEAAVEFLLQRGADPNIRCEGDYAFPLHFAAEKQRLPIIRLLVEHGADTNGEGDYHELGVIGWASAWDYVHANRRSWITSWRTERDTTFSPQWPWERSKQFRNCWRNHRQIWRDEWIWSTSGATRCTWR